MPIPRPKKLRRLLASLTFMGLASIAGGLGERAGAQAAPSNAIVAAPATTDPLQAAHFSLSLRGAPLPQLLTLLAQTTGLHFRYGAPPDTLVDTAFNNAPLLPSLAALLGNEGFAMQRAGYEVFLFRNAPGAAQARPAAWSYWTLPTPPPATWMVGQTLSATDGEQPPGAWQAATLQAAWAQCPGIAVTLPVVPPTATLSDGPVWLRWPIVLRHLPSGAQLLLETPAAANVYVNGAPLLRHWQGQRLLDLSHVLHDGLNCLALYWPHAPRAPLATPATPVPATSTAAPTLALLHYEWFFSTAPGADAPPATGATGTVSSPPPAQPNSSEF